MVETPEMIKMRQKRKRKKNLKVAAVEKDPAADKLLKDAGCVLN